jgi:hypothetical protein
MTQPTTEVPWWRNDPWLGAHLYRENRGRFPFEELVKYHHKQVAWFPDGSGIRDADADGDALLARIEASGDDPSWYCYEFVEISGLSVVLEEPPA